MVRRAAASLFRMYTSFCFSTAPAQSAVCMGRVQCIWLQCIECMGGQLCAGDELRGWSCPLTYHDSPSLGVHSQVLARDDAATATFAKRLLVNLPTDTATTVQELYSSQHN